MLAAPAAPASSAAPGLVALVHSEARARVRQVARGAASVYSADEARRLAAALVLDAPSAGDAAGVLVDGRRDRLVLKGETAVSVDTLCARLCSSIGPSTEDAGASRSGAGSSGSTAALAPLAALEGGAVRLLLPVADDEAALTASGRAGGGARAAGGTLHGVGAPRRLMRPVADQSWKLKTKWLKNWKKVFLFVDQQGLCYAKSLSRSEASWVALDRIERLQAPAQSEEHKSVKLKPDSFCVVTADKLILLAPTSERDGSGTLGSGGGSLGGAMGGLSQAAGTLGTMDSAAKWCRAIATHCLLHAMHRAVAQHQLGAQAAALRALLERVQQLVEMGADVNAALPEGAQYPPLALALLLERSASASASAGAGGAAAAAVAEELAQYLLRRGADPSCLLRWSLLMEERATSARRVLQLLLDAKKDLNVVADDAHGWSLLHYLALEGDGESVRRVVARVDVPTVNLLNTLGDSALLVALKRHSEAPPPQTQTQTQAEPAGEDKAQAAAELAAAEADPTQRLCLVLAKNANVRCVDRCGDPLLHVAIRKGHLALARRLCEMGAVPEVRDSHGDTALHCAVKRPGALALARWIAQRACASKDGAGRRLLDTRDERNGDTVLALAVKLGQEELALFFLALGAEPALAPRRWGLGLAPGDASASQQQDDPCAGDLPLQIAIKMRMAALAEAIVGACSENDLMRPDAEGRPALTLALSHGLLQLALGIANMARARLGVKALDAPCAKDGSTALHVALRRGLVMFAATLVELGASVNAQTKAGHSALHCCVELIGSSSNSGGGSRSSSSDLSSRSISPAGADKGLLQQRRQPLLPQALPSLVAATSPLALPLLAGLLTLMPSKKVDTRLRTGEQRLTALHLCVKGDRLPPARLLVDKCGAQLADDTDREGNSALALAVLRAHVPMVQLLLESGAGFDKVNKASLSPLHLAAQQPHPENSRDMARLLLNRGASPSVWDAQGRCPLHYAAERNLGDLIHTFALHCKVPGHLELRTEEGLTALMLAVRGGCAAATAALLEARVDLRHKAPGTRATALHLASALSADRKRPFWGSGVAEMLIEHCASTAVGAEGGSWDVDAAGVCTSDALEQLRRRVGFKEPEQLQTAVPASPDGAKQMLVVKPATASPASSPGPPSASASPPSASASPASASPASAAAVLATATGTATTTAQSAPPLPAKVVLAQPSAPPLPPRAGVSSAQPVLAPAASAAKPAAGAALAAAGALTGVGAFASAVAAKALAEGHAEPASAGSRASRSPESADPAHDAADDSSSRDEPSLPVRAQVAAGSALPAAGALAPREASFHARRHRPLHERARREGEAVALDWLATEQGQALLRKRAARLQQREPLSDAVALARARVEFVAKQADTIADRLLAA